MNKILLTGATGMVGRNILEHPAAQLFEFLTPSSRELNLLDRHAVAHYLTAQQPDMVIHAAGRVGGIQANMAAPVAFLVENMQMGINLITEAYQQGIPKLLNLASSCMYPRHGLNPLKETTILQGELEPTNEGYALAKIAATRLCEYIRQEAPQFQYKTAIPCNLYGRHDKFDPKHSHMIPSVINKIFNAKQQGLAHIDVWGDGLARREFMYAGDLADFVFFAIERFEQMPQNLNVGLGHDYTINEYYQAVADVIGFQGNFVHDLSKPVGMQRKLIDDTQLQHFGWQHQTSLHIGINKTVEFYLEQRNG